MQKSCRLRMVPSRMHARSTAAVAVHGAALLLANAETQFPSEKLEFHRFDLGGKGPSSLDAHFIL